MVDHSRRWSRSGAHRTEITDVEPALRRHKVGAQSSFVMSAESTTVPSPLRLANSALSAAHSYSLPRRKSCKATVLFVNPMLKPLRPNRGPTYTHALRRASPALDAIPVAACNDADGVPVAIDRRGLPRPQGTGCDIGAYEQRQR